MVAVSGHSKDKLRPLDYWRGHVQPRPWLRCDRGHWKGGYLAHHVSQNVMKRLSRITPVVKDSPFQILAAGADFLNGLFHGPDNDVRFIFRQAKRWGETENIALWHGAGNNAAFEKCRSDFCAHGQ